MLIWPGLGGALRAGRLSGPDVLALACISAALVSPAGTGGTAATVM